jgi:hypothetical protein
MTTIKSIRIEFNLVKNMDHSLDRARRMLSIQIKASRSRSRHAYRIETAAHLAAVCALDHAVDHRTRSELGRIRAESQYRFSTGGTLSRTVSPILN